MEKVIYHNGVRIFVNVDTLEWCCDGVLTPENNQQIGFALLRIQQRREAKLQGGTK